MLNLNQTLRSSISLGLIAILSLSSVEAESRRDARRQANRDHDQDYHVLRERIRVEKEVRGLPADEQLERLTKMLEENPSSRKQAMILLQIAKLYEAEQDLREAAEWAQKANVTDPENDEVRGYLKDILRVVDPKPTWAQKFRALNKKYKQMVDFDLGLDYASNVVQESVDPDNATDKEDTAITFNLGYTKTWPALSKEWGHETSYRISHFTYFSHGELDLLINNLEHRFNYLKPMGKDFLSSVLRVSISNIVNDDENLLTKYEIGGTVIYDHAKSRTQYDANLSISTSTYKDDANSGQEGENYTLSLGAKYKVKKDGSQAVKATLTEIFEEPETGTSQYAETALDVSYIFNFKGKWLSKVEPFTVIKFRNYAEAATGSDKRDDDQLGLGVRLVRRPNKDHTLNFTFEQTENESNLKASHYRNTQVKFSWAVTF